MADPSVVAEKLRGYRDSLMAQRLAVAGAFHHLTVAYAQLKSVWRGEGARQFEVEWAISSGARQRLVGTCSSASRSPRAPR